MVWTGVCNREATKSLMFNFKAFVLICSEWLFIWHVYTEYAHIEGKEILYFSNDLFDPKPARVISSCKFVI